MQELLGKAKAAITDLGIEPLRTNQTPVSFRSNVNLQNIRESNTDYYQSMIFRQNSDGDFTLTDGEQFQGFNQSENGTYLYIIQYRFDIPQHNRCRTIIILSLSNVLFHCCK